MIWSGSRLNFCQSLPRPHTSLWRFLFSMEWIGETFPRIWQASVRIDIPIVIDTFLLHDVQISVSRPGHINVFQWDRECFILRHVELNLRFIYCVDDRCGLQRHLLILSVETLPVRLEVLHWDLRSSRFVPAVEWVLGIRSLLLTIFLYHLLLGISTHLLFCDLTTSFALILRG